MREWFNCLSEALRLEAQVKKYLWVWGEGLLNYLVLDRRTSKIWENCSEIVNPFNTYKHAHRISYFLPTNLINSSRHVSSKYKFEKKNSKMTLTRNWVLYFWKMKLNKLNCVAVFFKQISKIFFYWTKKIKIRNYSTFTKSLTSQIFLPKFF